MEGGGRDRDRDSSLGRLMINHMDRLVGMEELRGQGIS
jgi:hypothetical protein